MCSNTLWPFFNLHEKSIMFLVCLWIFIVLPNLGRHLSHLDTHPLKLGSHRSRLDPHLRYLGPHL